ncbi:MAG TPA: AAA family ATPase [Kofleriaceae bacterium]|nr:AAA family ATPase [Kofleriaceae bacterium]
MRVDRIHLRDVGPFDDVTIDFPPGKDPDLADVYLLTGPNGSGKSTVLYAIAAAIIDGQGKLGRDLVGARLRARNSLVGLSMGETYFAVAKTDAADDASWTDPRGNRLLHTSSRGDGVRYFTNAGYSRRVNRIDKYADTAALVGPNAHRDGLAFDWAAFAYAGMRSLEDVHVTAVQDPQSSPFENSLSFVQTADTHVLASWVANQQFLRLKAKDAGRHDRAAQLEQSVTDIERVVADIIEDPTFRFVPNDDNNDIRVRWRGVDVDLGLLPDGLKSIVSWIADLLMRLDRIPWVDNVPTTQRSFLLLLDEVDIHLHPAWQRKVLPFVQRAFPRAQIIASTHSPFVVASAADAHVITLGLQGKTAIVEGTETSQIGVSYGTVLRSIFGIESDFDVDTERAFLEFHRAKHRLLGGDATARSDLDRLAAELAGRSEEVRELIALELGQLKRQLAQRPAS